MNFNFFKKNKGLSPQQQLTQWEEQGRPVPPPHVVKRKVVQHYALAHHAKFFVETGTYLGDMVDAQKEVFEKIYSIELSKKLHQKAVKRFANQKQIKILQGDSGKVLKQVMPELNGAAIFWLDGHYSGGITALAEKECPVPEELAIILDNDFHHIILIDDARLFDGTKSYPTITEIEDIVKGYGKKYDFEIDTDIIRLTPAN